MCFSQPRLVHHMFSLCWFFLSYKFSRPKSSLYQNNHFEAYYFWTTKTARHTADCLLPGFYSLIIFLKKFPFSLNILMKYIPVCRSSAGITSCEKSP